MTDTSDCECVKRLELRPNWLRTTGKKWTNHWFACPVFVRGNAKETR